jgi:hypothetical protein
VSSEGKPRSNVLDETQRRMLELLDQKGGQGTNDLRVRLGLSREELARAFETIPPGLVLVSVASLFTQGWAEITDDGRDALRRDP